jgi:hypothetical protein
MDPASDPALFVSEFQDANKFFFAYYPVPPFEGTFASFFTD